MKCNQCGAELIDLFTSKNVCPNNCQPNGKNEIVTIPEETNLIIEHEPQYKYINIDSEDNSTISLKGGKLVGIALNNVQKGDFVYIKMNLSIKEKIDAGIHYCQEHFGNNPHLIYMSKKVWDMFINGFDTKPPLYFKNIQIKPNWPVGNRILFTGSSFYYEMPI